MPKRTVLSAGDTLRAARLAADLSQPELAAKLGCTKSAVSRWESAERRPELGHALKLKEVLKIDPMVWL
jgi:transcriptional regulator with XRE-family HTH domain